MGRDFTLYKYRQLLSELIDYGYKFISFEDYLTTAKNKLPQSYIILRHDIDKLPRQAIEVAKIEKELNARASYYFRVVPESNYPDIIRQIAEMGYEVGYHYEDMALCQGDIDAAKAHFEHWLTYFREYYPVKTICMHGAPQSKWDGRTLWNKYSYKELGIIGEPYFDVNFEEVFYLTDTGRRWDGYKVSVRDKIPEHQERWTANGWVYHETQNIIDAAKHSILPKRIMMTTHPQRWHNDYWPWLYEYGRQQIVNVIKRAITKQ